MTERLNFGQIALLAARLLVGNRGDRLRPCCGLFLLWVDET
jgi:hypothetical protein